MFEPGVPRTGDELGAALRRLSAELDGYLGELDDDEFFARQGEFWSPGEHLRHLVKSVRAVHFGMSRPRPLLLVFGCSLRGSRGIDEISAIYAEALRRGGTATGRYTPSETAPDLSPSEWRATIVERWQTANSELVAILAEWKERSLDRYRLPHPLLGKLTVREMLAFTVVHNAHHARRIAERRQGASSSPNAPAGS